MLIGFVQRLVSGGGATLYDWLWIPLYLYHYYPLIIYPMISYAMHISWTAPAEVTDVMTSFAELRTDMAAVTTVRVRSRMAQK